MPIVSFTVSTPYAGNSPTGSSRSSAEVSQVIDMAVYKADEKWEHITELIAESKRRIDKEIIQFPDRPVVIEFGLESPHDSIPDLAQMATQGSKPHKSKAEVVANTLAIEYTPEVWSAYFIRI